MTYTSKAKKWLEKNFPDDYCTAEKTAVLAFASFLDGEDGKYGDDPEQQNCDKAGEIGHKFCKPRPQKIEELPEPHAEGGLGFIKYYPTQKELTDKLNEVIKALNSLINT